MAPAAMTVCLCAAFVLSGAQFADQGDEGEESDNVNYMQAAITIESGDRHVGTGHISDEEDDDGGDMLSYVQSNINIESGARQVGVAKSLDSSCSQSVDPEEDDSAGDLMSYMQAGVEMSTGVRQVGHDPGSDAPGYSHFSEDVVSF